MVEVVRHSETIKVRVDDGRVEVTSCRFFRIVESDPEVCGQGDGHENECDEAQNSGD